MALTRQMKEWAGKRFLQREDHSDRERKGVNLNKAESAAILYIDQDEVYFKEVKALVRRLHEHFGIKRVCALGYVDAPSKALPVYQAQKLEYMYFTRSDLNWHLKPKVSLMNFLSEPFDVLIVMSMKPCIPLRYILKDSKAHMKVGNSLAESEDELDMIIALDQEASLDSYLKQLEFYLTNPLLQ